MEIVAIDDSAPDRGSSAFGELRVRAVRALILDERVSLPAPAVDELRAWLADELGAAPPQALGLSVGGLDQAWRGEWLDALGWAGVPIARDGALRWGRDLVGDASADGLPRQADDVLRLPPAARLRALGSMDLKPVRAFVAAHLGCRLQSAAGVQCFLWPDRALLVSCAEVPIAGFFHGPTPGRRESVAIEPGGFQVLTW